MKKNKQNLKDLWDIIRNKKMGKMGVPEEEVREKEAEIFE